MIEAKLIPMETEFPHAPGAHRNAILNTAGQTEEYALKACGDTEETLCDNCQKNREKCVFVFQMHDLETGRRWKRRVGAIDVAQARKTLTQWGGGIRHIY